ncbi:MAG: hypothetical protein ACLPKT_19255, partial [Methylocella sp.]
RHDVGEVMHEMGFSGEQTAIFWRLAQKRMALPKEVEAHSKEATKHARRAGPAIGKVLHAMDVANAKKRVRKAA